MPITPAEQIESTQEAYEAGATLVHIHVRNDDETPLVGSGALRGSAGGHRRHCPGMIVQFSTGGRGRDPSQRGSALRSARHGVALHRIGELPDHRVREPHHLVEDLAATMKAYGVRPEIEIFDLSHLHGRERLVDAGLMDERPHVQFVMGVKNALPEEHLLDLLLGELRRVLPGRPGRRPGSDATRPR